MENLTIIFGCVLILLWIHPYLQAQENNTSIPKVPKVIIEINSVIIDSDDTNVITFQPNEENGLRIMQINPNNSEKLFDLLHEEVPDNWRNLSKLFSTETDEPLITKPAEIRLHPSWRFVYTRLVESDFDLDFSVQPSFASDGSISLEVSVAFPFQKISVPVISLSHTMQKNTRIGLWGINIFPKKTQHLLVFFTARIMEEKDSK